MLRSEFKDFNIGNMCNIRSIEIGYLSAEIFPIFWVIELRMFESEVAEGSGGLKSTLDVAGFAIFSLAHHNILFIRELLSEPFLLFFTVRVELLIYFSSQELRGLLFNQNALAITNIGRIEFIIRYNSDQSARPDSSRLSYTVSVLLFGSF